LLQANDEFNQQAQAVGEFFDLKRVLPDSIVKGIESGQTTAEELLKVIGSNKYVNVAVKDATDALNLIPAAPLGKIGSGVANTAKTGLKKGGEVLSDAAIKQTTGFSDDALQTLKADNQFLDVAKEGDLTRQSLGESVESAIKQRERGLSDTGKEYQAIRSSGVEIDNPMPEIEAFITKKGLKVKDGSVVETDKLSSNLTEADINAIDQAYRLIKDQEKLSADQLLNLRNKFDDLAGFESSTTTKGKQAIKGFRAIVDQKAKDGIPGLRELDTKFAADIKDLKARSQMLPIRAKRRFYSGLKN